MFSVNNKKTIKGFSLIEVLVTMAIIGIVTSLVMVRYGSFNSVVLLKNQAFIVALDVREAQVFAVSARGTANVFREEYGVHFNTALPNQYIFFLDNSTNGTDNPPEYDATPTNEIVGSPRLLDGRFEIVEICVNSMSVPCEVSNTRTDVSISFARPDFDAKFRSEGAAVNSARVTIASITDPTSVRAIAVSATGQITVE